MDRRRVAEYVDLLAKVRVYEDRELRQRIKERIADIELSHLPDSEVSPDLEEVD